MQWLRGDSSPPWPSHPAHPEEKSSNGFPHRNASLWGTGARHPAPDGIRPAIVPPRCSAMWARRRGRLGFQPSMGGIRSRSERQDCGKWTIALWEGPVRGRFSLLTLFFCELGERALGVPYTASNYSTSSQSLRSAGFAHRLASLRLMSGFGRGRGRHAGLGGPASPTARAIPRRVAGTQYPGAIWRLGIARDANPSFTP